MKDDELFEAVARLSEEDGHFHGNEVEIRREMGIPDDDKVFDIHDEMNQLNAKGRFRNYYATGIGEFDLYLVRRH